jgi:hypothetical protein
MQIIVFKYPTIEGSEKGIDKIFSYMDKNKINMQDYRLTRINALPESGLKESILYLSLGIRIRYRDNIEKDIRDYIEAS